MTVNRTDATSIAFHGKKTRTLRRESLAARWALGVIASWRRSSAFLEAPGKTRGSTFSATVSKTESTSEVTSHPGIRTCYASAKALYRVARGPVHPRELLDPALSRLTAVRLSGGGTALR